MQTFLPYPSFAKSARALDTKRLGKQRVETLQIMTALLEGSGWVDHPATKMWRGHEWALLNYQYRVCKVWTEERGFEDTCFRKTLAVYLQHAGVYEKSKAPPWLGNKAFHVSHQSNLIRKDPVRYGAMFPGIPDTLPYIWPEGE